MPDQSPQDAEKPDDVAGDRAIKDQKERPWLYCGVKVLVLIVVVACLVGANVVGEVNFSRWDAINFGWPSTYTVGAWTWIDDPCIFAHRSQIRGHWINLPSLSFNVIISITLLIYLNHIIDIFHRRRKPTYQVSLRFVVLVLPVVLGGIMALIHYDVLTWSRAFRLMAWEAVVVCLTCFIYEVRSFVKAKSPSGQRPEGD